MPGEGEYAEDSSDEEVGWATASPLQGGLCGHREARVGVLAWPQACLEEQFQGRGHMTAGVCVSSWAGQLGAAQPPCAHVLALGCGGAAGRRGAPHLLWGLCFRSGWAWTGFPQQPAFAVPRVGVGVGGRPCPARPASVLCPLLPGVLEARLPWPWVHLVLLVYVSRGKPADRLGCPVWPEVAVTWLPGAAHGLLGGLRLRGSPLEVTGAPLPTPHWCVPAPQGAGPEAPLPPALV